MPNIEAKKRGIKNDSDFRLRKKGSAHTTFYEHTELPEQVEKIMISSLAIKGISYRKPAKIN
ncbi:MAG: hypothetical protein WC784_03940 [Candidatus Shapirobacteria bacterium]|jgi:hypothetical protein